MYTITKINPWTPQDSKIIRRYYIDLIDGNSKRKIWVQPYIVRKYNLSVGMVIDLDKINLENNISRVLGFEDINAKKRVLLSTSKTFDIKMATFQAMRLNVDQVITIDELKEFERFVWKKAYGTVSWEKEKVRIDKVIELLKKMNNSLSIEVIGFGANTTEFLGYHPSESGSPDLKVINKNQIIRVEVTGTENMRGDDYWIRPDKLSYAQQYNKDNIWIVLHYQYPQEKFIYIKPDLQKEYVPEIKNIRGIDEEYVIFNDSSPEVKSFEEFKINFI